jgi:K+-sensing histidine kinase KdpD
MEMGTRSPLRRYGIALFCLALALQIALSCPALMAPVLFWPFLLAVLVSARYGGRGPGLLVSFGSTLILGYLLPPSNSLRVERLADFLWLELFVLASVLLGCWRNGDLRQTG